MNPEIRKIRRSFARVYVLLVFLCLCIAAMGVMAFMYFNYRYLNESGNDAGGDTNDVPTIYQPVNPPTQNDAGTPYNDTENDNENVSLPESLPRITAVQHPSSYVNRGSLVLVNSDNPFNPRGAMNLVQLHGNMTQGAAVVFSRNDHTLNAAAKEAIDGLAVAFGQAFSDENIVLIIQQAYTGIDFENHYNERNHGLTMGMQFWNREVLGGFTFDHGLMREQYNWMLENAAKFGLIQRFPPARSAVTGITYSLPGHFRYVGIPHALYMQENNLVLEEYLAIVKSYNFNNRLAITTDYGKWEVYFVPVSDGETTEIPVPTGAEHIISGNNTTGFIVAVVVE